METRDVTSDKTVGSAVSAVSKSNSVVSNVEVQTEKRVVKLSFKALADKLDKLQAVRRAKLNKANNIRKSLQGFIQKGDKLQVQSALEELVEVCDNAKSMHESLLGLLPPDEKDEHETWFKAKMMFNDECIADANQWVMCNEGNVVVNQGDVIDDGINPNDSVSNIESKRSNEGSVNSSRISTASSARIKAEADRAALVARVAALKDKHALEEQEQQLRRKREQLDLEVELAASTAKLAVLEAFERKGSSHGSVSVMNSHSERERKERKSGNGLNPLAKEYKPGAGETTQQSVSSLPPDQIVDVRPETSESQINTASSQQHGLNIQWPATVVHGTSQHTTFQLSDMQSASGQNPSDGVLTIMQRQNEITTALLQQQRSMSLPPRDIPIFDGDSLQYRTFIKAFEQGVEGKASKADCLYYLEQFTRGQPRDLVRSCQHMAPERGYTVAKNLLQEHFGNEYKIATAYIEKALAWKPVKSEDVKSLQAYALFLRGCCNVMEELQYMQEMDMPANLRSVISKLPFKLRDQWRITAYDIMETYKRRACFIDLVTFIERYVRILSDPLFGDIQESSFNITGTRTLTRLKPQPRERMKGNTFATTVANIDAPSGVVSSTSYTGKADKADCICCSNNHSLEECDQFNSKKHKEKICFLRENGVCFACLCIGHMSKDCKGRLNCKVCHQAHPTVLHIKRQSAAVKHSSDNNLVSSKMCGHTGVGKDRCALSILPVQVKSVKGNKVIRTYAFLDPGSSATFCSEQLMQKLNISGKQVTFLLSTMGQEAIVPAYSLTGLEVSSLDDNNFYQLPEVLTQQKMPVSTDNLIKSEDLAKFPYLSKVHIPNINANVDLLIGTNAPKILEPWEIINSCGIGPYAVRTVLGWVVNGPLNGNSGALRMELPTVTVNQIVVCRLEEMLINQYNHDFNESTVKKEMSREDIRFMEIMEQSAVLQDGRYCLKLPFKSKEVHLPNNFAVAKQRVLGLKKKFLNNHDFHQEYAGYMNDVISKGYAEQVPQEQLHCEIGKVWYIPHHGVHHPRKGSIRVVFDCGATFQGTSLNTKLLQGPNLTSSLLGVLTRFRQEPIAFMGDIQAMFHQVKVAEEDRNFLRFLWWPDGNISGRLVEYRMTVHLFGAVSSPSCASYALRKTADDNQFAFPPHVIQSVKQNFYVDDCLKSSTTEREAIKTMKALIALCQKGGFILEKWISNSRVLLQSISVDQRAKDLKELDLDRDKLPLERALGLQWCVETDSFKFKLEVKQQSLTRRGMLSITSSVYDPLGFLAPVMLSAKMMQQELCRRGCGWDDAIPQDILSQWKRWLEDLESLAAFTVDRCIKPGDFGELRHAQLHHFADASKTGYGTVTYIRMVDHENRIHIAFLLGKARVTPLKAVTIPRLELTAAVLATKVDAMLKEELTIQLEDSVFWTDSTAVLKYLNNEDKRFHTFVANRIATIREIAEPSQWRYVNSKDNPADDASRGMKVGDFLKNSRWLEGPAFLRLYEEYWPMDTLNVSIDSDDAEVKRETKVNAISANEVLNPTDQLIVYFSEWRRLKIAVAWFLKLKMILLERIRLGKKQKATDAGHPKNSQDKGVQSEGSRVTTMPKSLVLTLDDLLEAEKAIIRYSQQRKFSEEISALSSGKATVNLQSSIYRLDPFLDDGLLRVGGRLSKAAIPEEVKHPLILSKDQHISMLILKHVHESLGHGGRSHTLSTVRRKFWITNSHSAVRKIISGCGFCRRHNRRATVQKMADLPKERILPDLPPFTNTGVDYFGPVEVKNGRITSKRYGVLFTCMASRAIHLEVANSLETDACINALRRFISRRGQVTHLRSDNGTNFIGAQRELKEALAALNHEKIHGVLSQVGIRWSFNPPAGSHHGGVWERMIRSVKRVLSSVLRQQKLDDDGLHTVFCEVESILNDRPITKLSDDPNDLEPLTPNHLLLLKGKPALPPGVFEPHDLYVRKRWKQVQYLSDLFWKRWLREYLPLLQERQKWNQKKRSLVAGDIVVIMDSSAPRGSWALGKVLEVFPDKCGLVRSVKLQTKTSIIERPITKLCLLHEV